MKNKIRRICLFGGPGSGKSMVAAPLFSNMKLRKYNAEHVQEYVKTWAHTGRIPRSLDQWYIFGKQSHREDEVLRKDLKTKKSIVDLVVTDSPLFLQCTYAYLYDVPGRNCLLEMANLAEDMYPSLNIYLQRPKHYQQEGRFQDEKAAKKIDEHIRRCLDKWDVDYSVVQSQDPPQDADEQEALNRFVLSLTNMSVEALGSAKSRCR